MNKNKILIELYIPLIEKNYDLYIPINKKVGTVKKLIEEGGLATYAHYCLHKLKILPSQFAQMSDEEMAFIIASIDIVVEAEKEAEREAKRKYG